MNNRLLLFKSVFAFLFCALLSISATAQSSGGNQPVDATITNTQQGSTEIGIGTKPGEVINKQGEIESSEQTGVVISNDDPGITNPPASFYENLEDRVEDIEAKMSGLDPQSQEYLNLDKKLKSINNILENK